MLRHREPRRPISTDPAKGRLRSVAISGAAGTPVAEIAFGVAERIGLPLHDERIVEETARRLDRSVAEVRPFDGRLIAAVGRTGACMDFLGPLPGWSLWCLDVGAVADDVHRVTNEVILEVAGRGAVVVGRGAPQLLAGDPLALSVRLLGPRGRRTREERADAAYVRSVHRARIDDPSNYDLILDMTTHSAADAMWAIVQSFVAVPSVG